MNTEDLSARPHCILIGIGAGTGAACARRFSAEGYKVSMLARSRERLARFANDIEHTTPYRVDINELDEFRATLEQMVADHGVPKVVIYNATLATFTTYKELAASDLERNFRVNTAGLMVAAQTLGPAMEAAQEGAIIVTGNTAALRGKPGYVGWSCTKAAQRNMAECLARELGPKGIHVAYVVIDAVIDMPFARRRWTDQPEDFFAKPDDLAHEIYNVAHQPRSAWSFAVELRPFGEVW
ncbi:MAG: SDR family NAD(P)-dependent oxidoreductase [Gammaproteobacteria bacterium]|nr:SDR family NAD(P)-dependent oxidoreductase [Gammaproteobacteria bacterium]